MTKQQKTIDLAEKLYQDMLELYNNCLVVNGIDYESDIVIPICGNFLDLLKHIMFNGRPLTPSHRTAFKHTVNLMVEEILQEGEQK